MDVEIKMPDLSTTESEVTLVRWLVEEGQSVQRGQALLEIETDKAVMEVESIAKGTLKSVLLEAGEKAAVGQVVAVVAKEGLVSVREKPSDAKTSDAMPQAKESKASIEKPSAVIPKKEGGSFFARNRQAKAESTPKKEAIELSLAQRTVARKMLESKQSIPHFYLQSSINAEPMVKRRNSAAGQKLAWDAFFVLAAAKALQDYPKMGCSFESDKLVPQSTRAIGVAVGVGEELYVIPIEDPTSKTIETISSEIREKVNRIRSGDQEAGRLAPANLTITNLGGANIESFIPIINPPEAAILSVGKIIATVVSDKGEIVVQDRAALILAVDHRVVNGVYAANFLNRIIEECEQF